ncbi:MULTISPECIES: YfhD family protein [Gracilibacillus]|uniref:YfhD family protein n=1 Tax=Gracilibacillus dipsosauri TaxID=178340 RepID=A0A317L047_9BACI|nr:YfhD family protein [Gracilibacillus dipsosauri]PWU68943.1 YfhD family protein [Gracilibacillus dipsosauri]
MGKDEHKLNSNRNKLAQTPKNQIGDGLDIEFSEEVADIEDKQAQARSRAADKRVKGAASRS